MQRFKVVGISDKQSARTSSDSSALANVMRTHASGSGTNRQPAGNAAMPPIETHWSRIFYYDLFAKNTGGSTRGLGDLTKRDLRSPASRRNDKERFVAANASSRDEDSRPTGSALQAAAILLAICVAVSLAIAEVVHGPTSPDAAAVEPNGSPTPASAATASASPAHAETIPADAR